MEFTPDRKKKLTAWIIAVVAICTVIFLGIQRINVVANAISWCFDIVSPLIVGLGFALILNVPMVYLENLIFTKTQKPILKKLKRPICFIISLILIIGILAGVIMLVIPELVNAIKIVAQASVEFVGHLSSLSEQEIRELPFGNILLSIDWDSILSSLQNWLKNQGSNIVNTAFGTVTALMGGIFDFFISFVFSIYILFGKDKLRAQTLRLIKVWIPENAGNFITHTAAVASKNFSNFISGQSIEAVILGVLCMVGMLVLRLPYAPMVGALVGVTALIPVVGAFIGLFVGAFMILTVSPLKAVIFVVFLLILQQVENNLIYPKVMGSKVNLPGMWILAAVTVGGGLCGALGMLLSVPVAATVYVLIKEATDKKEKEKKAS
jgi:predicted PurR-regulated permease PerM